MARSNSKPPTSKSRSRAGGRRKTPRQETPPINLTLDQKLDILGIALVALGGFTLLSKLSLNQGSLTKPWLDFLSRTFGWGVYVVPLALLAAGGWLLLRSFEQVPKPSVERAVGYVLALLVGLLTLQVIALVFYPGTNVESIVESGAGGGSIGEGVREALVTSIGALGTGVLMLAWWLVALVMCLGLTPSQLLKPLVALVTRLRIQRQGPSTPLVINNGSSATRSAARPPAEAAVGEPHRRMRPQVPVEAPAHILGDSPAGSVGPLYRTAPVPQVAWELPKIEDIFELGGDSTIPEDDLRIKANIIEETLHHLGVEGKVIEVNRGPAITQFGVEPGFITSRDGKQTKVKVSRITALADDLALALAARTIRIEAPVPGRNIVGIEVPNAETALVALRDVMESEEFVRIGEKNKLAIALGQDVSGQPVAADLAAMPHLLIAGTTGSGKSVCVNSIIACLLTRNTPDDLRLLMVDPKRVELTTYNGIPHLMAPVVVDLERVVGILQWVTREMDMRYHKFAKAGARNIDDYNDKATAQKDVPGAEKLIKMPYIVVIIDELADLMMLAPDETERTICRLAQMARATGIHLVLATQRPSVDVVTGLIKANFPARISFAVASSVDSRVVLDGPGAEQLLGRGDMLFVSPDVGQPVRLQGCYVSDKEILKLTRYWKGTRGTTDTAPVTDIPIAASALPVQQPLWDDMRATMEKAKEAQEDDLLGRAIEVVKLQRRASISLLQRKLQIGYTRAARLIDLMEQKGVVGPAMQGERWREVLVVPPGGVSDTDEAEF
jgi:S-DNA-T family DNA segregation ATPase FtsK/SpoIIIE